MYQTRTGVFPLVLLLVKICKTIKIWTRCGPFICRPGISCTTKSLLKCKRTNKHKKKLFISNNNSRLSSFYVMTLSLRNSCKITKWDYFDGFFFWNLTKDINSFILDIILNIFWHISIIFIIYYLYTLIFRSLICF